MKNIVFILCLVIYGCLFTSESNAQINPPLSKNYSFNALNKAQRSGLSSALQAQKIVASDQVDKNGFGSAVSLDGDRALVGAHNNEAAYIFKLVNNQWQQIAILQSSNPNEESFGNSVSLYGDRALVGAYTDDVNGPVSGSVYVFESVDVNGQEFWVQTDKITDSSGQAADYFGWNVSLYQDTALIGAPYADGMVGGDGAGAAFVYEFNGNDWQYIERLYGLNNDGGDAFGDTVSLFEDYAVVGAPNHDNIAININDGAAFIFQAQGTSWLLTHEIAASDATASQNFGDSVSMGNDRVLIGASGDQNRQGAAYVFDKAEVNGQTYWIQTNKITASDGQASDNFGKAVKLDGQRALIGAISADASGTDSGTAYVYQYTDNTWQAQHKLSHPDIEYYDRFGLSVDLSGNHLIVGTENYDTNNQKPDAAYIYNLDVIFKNGFE